VARSQVLIVVGGLLQSFERLGSQVDFVKVVVVAVVALVIVLVVSVVVYLYLEKIQLKEEPRR